MGRISAILALTIGAVLWAAATPARAHAVLVSTEPAADAIVDEAPSVIVLSFNEPVRPVALRLIDGGGGVMADESTVRVADDRIELPLGAPLHEGGYIVTWRVMSADSHPFGGSFRFVVGDLPSDWQAQANAPPAPAGRRFWSIGLGMACALHSAGLLIAAGGIWFARLVASDRPELQPPLGRIVRIAAGVGALAALAGVGLQGGLLLAAPPFGLLLFSTWQAGLSTPIGRMLAACALMLGSAAALTRRPSDTAASLAALLAVMPLGFAGHVSVAEPRWLTGPSLILHAALAAFWLGSLPPLLVALRLLPEREAAVLLRRFSRLGVIAVVTLAAAGTMMAAIQLRTLPSLWETSYGMVLAAKLILVAGLVLVALANKQRVTPALVAERPQAAARLSRNIWFEIMLIGAILALTAALGFATPPRALQPIGVRHDDSVAHDHARDQHHGHEQPTLERQAMTGSVTAALSISPGRPGLNRLSITVRRVDGVRVEPIEVEARLGSTGRGIEPVERRLTADGERFTLETSDMALPGTWQIRLDVLVTEFEKVTFYFELDIR